MTETYAEKLCGLLRAEVAEVLCRLEAREAALNSTVQRDKAKRRREPIPVPDWYVPEVQRELLAFGNDVAAKSVIDVRG